jgi:hypothetical protein
MAAILAALVSSLIPFYHFSLSPWLTQPQLEKPGLHPAWSSEPALPQFKCSYHALLPLF